VAGLQPVIGGGLEGTGYVASDDATCCTTRSRPHGQGDVRGPEGVVMENLIAQSIIAQAYPGPYDCWGSCFSCWHWGFWVAFFVGLAGAVVLFFMKPTQGA